MNLRSRAKGRPYLVLATFDEHHPRQDKRAIALLERYIADETFDEWVNGGDFVDNHELSRYVAEYPGQKLKDAVPNAFDSSKGSLKRRLAVLRNNNNRVRVKYLEGNHEHRSNDMIDRMPHMGRLLSIPHALELKAQGVDWLPFWSRGAVHQIGKLGFGHGKLAGHHHAATHVRKYLQNFVYGHVHHFQEFSVDKGFEPQSIAAFSTGCLCQRMEYEQGEPNRHELGFRVVAFFPDGGFQMFPVRIIKYQFWGPTNMKLYKG